jgi:hypothetical protein
MLRSVFHRLTVLGGAHRWQFQPRVECRETCCDSLVRQCLEMQVILIHLSNLTGLQGEYSRRTMFLLVSDLGTIVWGVSAANAKGVAKVILFCVGLCYGCNTFYNAARVYIESYHTVPKGICRQLVMVLAWMFFVSWAMFPLGFISGMALFYSFCTCHVLLC